MGNIVSAFTSVWGELMTFITSNFSNITSLFYTADGGLTFVGTIAVVSAGIAVLLLIWNLIRSFFTFHG